MKKFYQSGGSKVEMWPGSKSIIRELDWLVDKCTDKINSIRSHANIELKNASNIESKQSALIHVKHAEAKAIKKNRLIIKKTKLHKKKKIRGNYSNIKL